MTRSCIGQPQNRVDGRVKVTGAAKYAAEHGAPDLAYGWVVSSTIARGRIIRLDTSAAMALEGVIAVFTHDNRPHLPWFDRSYKDDVSVPGSPFRPLYDDKVVFSGQPIALVVAETLELARYAASLVSVDYAAEPHETDFMHKRNEGYVPPKSRTGVPPPAKPRGDAERAFREAGVHLEADYRHSIEHHNPMEMHATTVVRESDGRLTIYDKTQGAQNVQRYVVSVFDYAKDDVRAMAPYVGGAFGSGLRPQYQVFLAVLAARELRRSIRVVLTRQQMFTIGYRPDTLQRVALGASADGMLRAIMHNAVANTSRFEDYQENLVNWSGALYKCDNTRYEYQLVQLDQYTPCDMRAPGGATGMFALECAMDELAHRAGIDPLELRLRNHSDRDQNADKPFSSNELRACFAQGAARFGWSKRDPRPRSMREGRELIGWGVATGIWDALQMPASARAVLTADGTLEVSSATTDIGTGTYTIMTQIAADTLGLPMEAVTFRLGDSKLPTAPVEGGSWTAASVGSAVKAACDAVREKAFKLAQGTPESPLAAMHFEDALFVDGEIRPPGITSHGVRIVDAMKRAHVERIDEEASSSPGLLDHMRYAMYAHSAVFAEVRVDEDLGSVRVTRVVNAVAAGRILNPKTARSQIMGGVVWGIGMALHEETLTDHALGRFMNHNFAEYHVPVNADVHDIDVIFVDEKDEIINPLGVKGVGEIGIVGTAAAIANAVFHATGRRVRDLPITLDKLIAQ